MIIGLNSHHHSLPRGEPWDECRPHVPGSAIHVLNGGKGCPAEGAAEVAAVEPAVEADLVEHVAAGELAHVVPILEVAEADDAAVLIRGQSGGETAGEGAVEVELIGDSDEAGEAGAEGGEDRVIEVEGLRGRG